MRNTAPNSAKSIPSRFFVKYHPRPLKAYHLRLPSPVQWTYARDVQNAIIKAYQAHHHNIARRPLPPTFITLQFKPVFTYGRNGVERPSQRERMMLEGLPGTDGLHAETRMAWGRERGWRYHGPGQIHCWMVADLEDWNWELQDVKRMMDSSLTAMLAHYLPSRGTQMQSAIAMPFTQPHLPISPLHSFASSPFSNLTTIELHENNYKIISYGCSLNVHESQSIGTRRLSRYGFPAPETTSLSEQGWVNQESISHIQDRFVSEMTRRFGTEPEDVDTAFLSRRLRAEVPERDVAMDKVKRRHPDAITAEDIVEDVRNANSELRQRSIDNRRTSTPRLEFNAVSLKKGEDAVLENNPMLVPSWRQYVRVALKTRLLGSPTSATSKATGQTSSFKNNVQSDIQRAGSEISQMATRRRRGDGPPRKVLEQTIQWSTSAEIFFTPHTVEAKDTRRTVVSPRELQDEQYLGDLPTEPRSHSIILNTTESDSGADTKLSTRIEEASSSRDIPETIAWENNETDGAGQLNGAENKVLKEQQKRVINRLRASGEDRI